MRIAVLSINIGAYIVFWKAFYETAEKNFFPGTEKDYYIFTDKEEVCYKEKDNVHVVCQSNLGWPGNTLMRYHMFINIREELQTYDYVFFGNADCIFIEKVGEEILPDASEKLVFCKKNEHVLKKGVPWPYESNPMSTAYVEPGNTIYVQGGFWGGESAAILEMCDRLSKNVDADLKQNIIAIWHDESHLTKYAIEHQNAKFISPSYQYPEKIVMPFPKRIVNRRKTNSVMRYGKKEWLKNFKIESILLLRNIWITILIRLKIIKYQDD